MPSGRTLARALGLFSLGLGILQLAAPRRFSGLIGLRPREEREVAARVVGLRELAAAAGLLARPFPVAFMWMRVLGDLMDLALLDRARRSPDARPQRVNAALAAVLGVTALDLVGSLQLTREADEAGGRRVRKAITVLRPRAEVYAFWREFERFPRFMQHVEEVRRLEGGRTHWRAKGPLGTAIEWEAETVEDRPNEVIAWRSLEGSAVQHGGYVQFRDAPGDRGTEVIVDMLYDPPGGPLGVAIAKLSGEEPEQQASDDLRRFKQVMETGEVVISEATYGERRVRQRPAQPLPPEEVPAVSRAVA